jgi:hypothetical protein
VANFADLGGKKETFCLTEKGMLNSVGKWLRIY